MSSLEKSPESVHPEIIGKYEALQNHGVNNLGNALGLKASKLADISLRVGRVYALVKQDGSYSLTENGKVIKKLDEEDMFLDTYNFTGFAFSLKKSGSNYEMVGKDGQKLPFLVSTQNLDSFRKEFTKVGGIILIESQSALARKDLAHAVEYKGPKRAFPGVHEINSSVSWDVIHSDVDMDNISKYIDPKPKTHPDQEKLLRFFLDHLDVKA